MRSKKSRYEASVDETLLIQSDKEFFDNCKGKRACDYFKNTNPTVLELACGRGEYTVWLSQIFPNKNFIGVDVKGERMMLWIKRYRLWIDDREDSLWDNIAFLRTIIHHLDRFFSPEEVDEIWIIHPDPRPKWHDERRRLTSPRFLNMYYNILKPGGILRLKTDDNDLFSYSLEQLWNQYGFELSNMTKDLHQSDLLIDHHNIITHYEQEALKENKTIKYAVWKKYL